MKFDVLGLGNALVDETFYVEKEFLEGTDLFFNQFKSISYENQEAILAKLPSGETPDVMCGGSTTNSLVATSNFGTICGHICQLSDDDRGKLYERNLKDNGIYSLNNFYHQDVRTGRCLVFITPASERTMGTYLGASERLVFDENFVTHANNSKILFSEGYQFTSDENFEAFFRVLSEMNKEVKFALSLSDPGVVQGFRDRFEKVIASRKIDYLFCNREEAIALVGENFADELKQIAVNFAVTNGAENSIVFDGTDISKIDAFKVDAIDSNGAGDIFAGAALHKVIEGENFAEACRFVNFASSRIVQEKSPRLTIKGYKDLLQNFKDT